MVMTYRDEKGTNLTPDEIDANFRTLQEAINAIVVPDGVGIADFIVSGPTFTVVLTDATVMGPFPLPERPAFEWRREWEAGETYAPFDVFSVAGQGIYLVLDDYVAPTEFDPDVTNSELDAVLDLMLGLAPDTVMQVTHSTSNSYILTPDNMGGYLRMEDNDPIDVVVQEESIQGWVEGNVVTVRRVDGPVTFVEGGTSVLIVPPIDCLPQLRTEGSSGTLIYAGGDVWDLAGDLALIGTE